MSFDRLTVEVERIGRERGRLTVRHETGLVLFTAMIVGVGMDELQLGSPRPYMTRVLRIRGGRMTLSGQPSWASRKTLERINEKALELYDTRSARRLGVLVRWES